MTEYGRGHGSQPWHPEDPLYGDRGGDGAQQQPGWDQHGGQPQPYQDPHGQGTHGEGIQGQGTNGHGSHGQDAHGHGPQDQSYGGQYDSRYGEHYGSQYDNQYGEQQGWQQPGGGHHGYPAGSGSGYHPAGGQQPGQAADGHYGGYGDQSHGYGGQQHTDQQHADQSHGGYGGHQQDAHDPYASGAGYADPADPYGQNYGYQDPAVRPDTYATPDAYPPPRPPHGRGQEASQAPGPDPETGWDPGPELDDHAFFAAADPSRPTRSPRDEEPEKPGPRAGRAGRRRRAAEEPEEPAAPGPDGTDPDEDTDEDPRDGGRRAGRSRRGSARRKNGMACLIVAVVLVGGVGGAGYYAYTLYKERFASAPDYAGQGSGEVQVTVPEGANLGAIARILEQEGVVKSAAAFVSASAKNQDALRIQAGSYVMRKEMSAAAAVELMLNPASQSGLIIPEGLRASRIYQLIDERTESPEGTTEKAAEKTDLGLPSWANGEVEGFLFPSRYSVTKNSEPAEVLKEMVKRAKAEFRKVDLETNARKVNRSPYEVLIIASLIQAEAQEDEEFGKVSRVIYNRLEPGNSATNGKLDFDSTINYALGRSTLDVSVTDTKLDHPYNTYRNAGLPPGPIDNPGHQAIEAALNPTKGDWLYFVTVKPGDTRFTSDFAEHNKHVRDFNEEQRRKREAGG
ncbi:endolytic transglycosylase MltG [Streptomyces durbertensis]|uniref:Endolytic murein transglycosylase n=1 Tax=Streptomyces durbertensis TaxID=2448886 RepID=A0ABR6EHH3_9ACTN|nr:endolytic transglycosylase MltG [Streptomyces durbertensis]MBB1244767.1 endolytic transglycosylase MltG [Streptomyces durbertensis]